MRAKPEDFGGHDSAQELHFEWWLQELKDEGYVKDFGRAESIQITNGLDLRYKMERISPKTGKSLTPKEKTLSFYRPLSYTPDFYIEWEFPSELLFYVPLESIRRRSWDNVTLDTELPSHLLGSRYMKSFIEVKPALTGINATNHSRLLAARQIGNILSSQAIAPVNLVTIGPNRGSLFDRTFCPRRYYFTDKTRKPRTIHFNPRTLAEFVRASYIPQIVTGI